TTTVVTAFSTRYSGMIVTLGSDAVHLGDQVGVAGVDLPSLVDHRRGVLTPVVAAEQQVAVRLALPHPVDGGGRAGGIAAVGGGENGGVGGDDGGTVVQPGRVSLLGSLHGGLPHGHRSLDGQAQQGQQVVVV